MADTKELAIIEDVKNGNSDNYRFLVERYHRGLIQHLYNVVHDYQLAEDLAQEAFIRAYNKLAQYNSDYSFSTWLYKIADNLAYRQFEKAKPTGDINNIEELVPDDKPTAAELVDKTYAQEAIRQAIDRLPLGYKRVVLLYYWDNFSYEEIANIIERPIGTVRTWLYRAKDELRKELYEQV